MEVAVVEAGLGGRWDATNVLGAEVVVLTNVGLEHTRWLGPTIADIAGEKLAVVREGATLVLGDDAPEVVALAEHDGREDRPARGRATTLGGAATPLPGYQRRNFAAALAAAEALLGEPLDAARVAAVAARVRVPGRLQVVAQRPADDLRRRAQRARHRGARPTPFPKGTVAVLSILDDKDAAEMLRALLPRLGAAVFTRAPNPRALPPATLADLAGKVGGIRSEIEPDPRRAVEPRTRTCR